MIKNMLRKWLEVPDEYIAPDVVQPDFKAEIRATVIEVVVEAFRDDDIYTNISIFSRYDFDSINGTIKKNTVDIIKHQTSVAVLAKVAEVIEPEAFIDAVVKRIQSKQLGGQ